MSLVNMQKVESFHQGDGDEFYEKYLHRNGWIQLWRPAPYHWVAIHIERRCIISYTEGDVTKKMYSTEGAFMQALQETKDWWVKYTGKSADPVLVATAEPYGFLTWDKINLNPPRCETCKRLMFSKKENDDFECIWCKG